MAITKRMTRKGARYKATVWRAGRPICTKSFARKIDAQLWLQNQKQQRIDRQCGRLRGDSLSLRQFVTDEYLRKATVSPGTLKEYTQTFTKHIFPKLGSWNLMEISRADWADFLSALITGGMSNARANRVRSTVSAAYRHALREGVVLTNPLHGLPWYRENTRDISHWRIEEAQTFLNHCQSSCRELFPLYLMGYETGMRFSELVGLKWDCVELHEQRITVRRAWCSRTKSLQQTTKSGHKRVLPMSEILRERLIAMRAGPDEFVFRASDKPISYHSLKSRFKTDQKRAGVRRIGIHGLRHSFASHFLMNGGALPELKEILGHADYETTLRYAHLADDYLLKKASLVKFQPSEDSQKIVRLEPNSSQNG